MKCTECQFVSPEGAKFCGGCGDRFMIPCSMCHFPNTPQSRFCAGCGQKFEEPRESTTTFKFDSERKHATVLFTDMTGYTAMCEQLDPEEVKDIMSRVFGEIAQVVTKYKGFIEKFIGDGALVLFGVPEAHEDDPVRAIRAAREIHNLVENMRPRAEDKGWRPLSMHSGINTGLLVTGGVDAERGSHGVTGDTINFASRLSSMGKAGEILVGPYTYRQTEGHFHFETLKLTRVQGKTEPVRIYKVLSPKESPSKTHRVTGLRAELIGRKAEKARLAEAIEKLRTGKGEIICICGEPGTGKSRLVEEFKASLDHDEIQWREGHAYEYSQNTPYFPITDLLSRIFRIEEADPPQKIREKVEKVIENLLGRRTDVIPYIGSLFALTYPEIENMSPDSWKFHLQRAVKELLSSLFRRAPTVICMEDLHWADPSSLDLLRFILLEGRQPALFICVYRPPCGLFLSHQLDDMADSFKEIHLQDLSSSESQDMVESLLQTGYIPPELSSFIQEKVEGNPFYLEEVINSLIESEMLINEDGLWRVSGTIDTSVISPTIHGVISARLDRLEKEERRILQEASVIGRTFLYDVLLMITELKNHIDRCLNRLERIDLIRARSFQPELEYAFKHALIKEVVYNGLITKERQEIHQQISLVIEKLFAERLPEFYETLAYHYTQGRSMDKAVDYLVKSGEKNLARYSLEESHRSFQQAYELLCKTSAFSFEMGHKEGERLVELLIKWASVLNWRGAFKKLIELFKLHENIAESLDDKKTLGMYYSWLGLGLQSREKLSDAYRYLLKALKIGEEIDDDKIIGYASAWLATTCADMGLLEDALTYGKRAREVSGRIEFDPLLFLVSSRAIGYVYYFRGESRKVYEVGKMLLEYGLKQSDLRFSTVGHLYKGIGHHIRGDFPAAIDCCRAAIQVSIDPMLYYVVKTQLALSLFNEGRMKEAEEVIEETIIFSKDFGSEWIGSGAKGIMGLVLIAKGELDKGVAVVEEAIETYREMGSKWRISVAYLLLGNIFLKMVLGEGSKDFSYYARNIRFLVKNIPVASKRTENFFIKAIEISREIGATGILGQASLGLGILHKSKGRTDKSRKYILDAIESFEKCEAGEYLKQAREALES